MNILEELGKKILFFDGGMGSQLQQKDMAPGENTDIWNLTRPEDIMDVHRRYLQAGADIILTNTFGANGLKLEGTGYTVEQVVKAGVVNARKAIDQVCGPAGRQAYVALDIAPTGKLLKPLGDLSFDGAYQLFKEIVVSGAEAGADFIHIETMSDTYELKAAVLAAKENANLPVFATVTFDERGKMLTGGSPEAAVALLEGLGVDALGLNCGLGPVEMEPMIVAMLDAASIPVIVQPNAGLPRQENGQTVYDVTPVDFAKKMKEFAEKGAWILGGCCGTTPEHIRQLRAACGEITPKPLTDKGLTVVSSYTHGVRFGEDSVLIGERINPTGKSRFKQALRERDMDYILEEGFTQEEKGAQILDINVGLPEINEEEMIVEVMREVQGVINLPLQIDTSNPAAMERALRYYNGKAMVNSVNGKQESMEAVFPLVKKYGGVVVGLTLDEEGIPETAQGRLRVAEKIVERAEAYGIKRKDIVIDVLCMTISSDSRGAVTTLEALKLVKEKLGVKTILGVSNISFGLPRRDIINANFYAQALAAGLDCAIMNPNAEGMMQAYHAYRALTGKDENCQDFINTYAGTVAPAASAASVAAAPSAVPAPATGASSAAAPAIGAAAAGGIAAPSAASAAAAGATDSAAAATASSSAAASSAATAAGSAGAPTPSAAAAAPGTLEHAIIKGLKEQAGHIAGELVKTQAPLTIINEQLVPALDVVGQGFEKGTVFLPQLLMSAEAAKAAFASVRAVMEASGKSGQAKKDKIIVATVKGDIHDIGKNIVKVLLENYGYDVRDLGKDVAPEAIVELAVAEDVKLVGLSALMTTTVTSMEETIRQLQERKPDCKVMVGGAVLTQKYADMIHADYYAKDAMASVYFSQKVLD